MQPEKLAAEIIREQSLIIGENLAKSRAEDTGTIKFNSYKIEDLTFTQQDATKTLEGLIRSYEELFGQASVEVCLEVIKRHSVSEVATFLPQDIKDKVIK